jgi:hypothetical protein
MFGHAKRQRAIQNTYQPAIDRADELCAGRIFANRYLLSVLRELEPSHPLLDPSFRERLGRWSSYSAEQASGTGNERLEVAKEAGRTFAIPPFTSSYKGVVRASKEEMDAYWARFYKWGADQEMGIMYPEPEMPEGSPMRFYLIDKTYLKQREGQ